MMVGERGQERPGLIRREALHFGAHNARGIGDRRDVLRDELPLDRAVERDAEHRAEVLTRPRRQPCLALLIEEGVDVLRLQPAEFQMAEPWHEMEAHELRVTVMRFRADGEFDGVDPAFEELLKGEHLATFWTMRGASGRDITCAAFRVATGFELRASYSDTDIIGTKLFRGPRADEQLADAADQWRTTMLAKGFREIAK